MGCKECGKPKCNGKCGCKSPKVLQINNPAEYITFHKVSIPAAMGDSATNPPKIGAYRNALVYYEADHTSWMYSTDGIPTKLTNGLTDYNEAVNLPQINGHTLIGNQSSSELGLQGELTAGTNIQINGNTISATDTTYTAGNGIELDGTEIKAKIGDGLEFDSNGEIDIADIEQYAHFFDNVAEMKSAENLVNGSYAQTLGYHAKNDGGGGLYKIRNVTNDDVVDERTIIAMNDVGNNLVAELIVNNNEINVNQFGAYGDGTHDDTTAIQASIDYASSNSGTVRLLNKTYIITNLTLTGHISVIGQGQEQSVLKAKAGASGNMITSSEFGWLYIHLADFKIDGNKDNATMSNGLYIDRGVNHEHAHDSFITVERLLVSNVSGDGIYNGRGGRENRFINCVCEYCGGNGINSIASDSYFEGITCKYNTKNGLHVGSTACRFINIKCFLNGYNNSSDSREEIAGFCVDGYNNLFSECDAQENYGDGFYIKQGPNNFINCLADANGFKSQRYNDDGTYADMTDEELLYDGFHIATIDWYVRESQFIVMVTDHRRSSHHQLQRYGVNMGNCQKCTFNITGKDNVALLHYDSTYHINQDYYGADNIVILNGVTIGTAMIDRIAMMNDANTRNAIDFFTGADNTKKVRVTSGGTDIFQFNNMNGNTYKDTPFSIKLNDSADGVITLGDSNSNYTLKLIPRGLGFFGKSPVAQQTSVANATDLASCITLCNALKTKLQNYGLIASD